jgi:hypothetical protein
MSRSCQDWRAADASRRHHEVHAQPVGSPQATDQETFPMRFFVTGGAGFIGSNYVRHLLATDP